MPADQPTSARTETRMELRGTRPRQKKLAMT